MTTFSSPFPKGVVVGKSSGSRLALTVEFEQILDNGKDSDGDVRKSTVNSGEVCLVEAMETIKSWKGKVIRSRSPLRGLSRSISEYMISTSSAFCLPLPLGQNHRRSRPVDPANSFDLDHYYSDEDYDPTDHGFIASNLMPSVSSSSSSTCHFREVRTMDDP